MRCCDLLYKPRFLTREEYAGLQHLLRLAREGIVFAPQYGNPYTDALCRMTFDLEDCRRALPA